MMGPNDKRRIPDAEQLPDLDEGPPPEDVVDPEDWGGPLIGDLDDRSVLEPRWVVDVPPELKE